MNTGILIQSSGSSHNTINENSFLKLGVGTLSNYMNTNSNDAPAVGLQYLCNSYYKCRVHEGARGTDTTQHGVRIWQGMPNDINNGNRVADNAFVVDFQNLVLYNPNSQVNRLKYYWKNGANKYPLSSVGTVERITLSSGLESCTTPSYNPAHLGNIILYHHLALKMQDDYGGMNRDSVRYYAQQIEDQYGDLVLTDMLLEEGNIEEANDKYDDITTRFSMNSEEEQEFDNWGRRLMNLRIALIEDTLDVLEIDSAQVDTLELIADNAKMWARSRAQGWLTMYDGRTFDNEMLYPDTTITGTPDSSDYGEEGGGHRHVYNNGEEPMITELAAKNSYIYPNPVKDHLIVVYTGEGGLVTLSDITGRIVLKETLKQGENKLDVQKLATGIYLYRLKEGETDAIKGKIMKE